MCAGIYSSLDVDRMKDTQLLALLQAFAKLSLGSVDTAVASLLIALQASPTLLASLALPDGWSRCCLLPSSSPPPLTGCQSWTPG